MKVQHSQYRTDAVRRAETAVTKALDGTWTAPQREALDSLADALENLDVAIGKDDDFDTLPCIQGVAIAYGNLRDLTFDKADTLEQVGAMDDIKFYVQSLL